jgi:peroxiredoxin
MNHLLIFDLVLVWLFILIGCWLGWQLLRQNGRLLLRLEEMEQRLDELELRENAGFSSDSLDSLAVGGGVSPNEENRASRFSNHSLARSRIDRNGLKAGTRAPSFRLPQLDGRDMSLADVCGRRLLLVFSDPHCGPCNSLAPQLEKLHRENPELAVVMISRGDPKENRAKVQEHGLSFPVVLQQRWEISRRYAMFATPIAYLIDEEGVIESDVAVGAEAVLRLAKRPRALVHA